MKALRFVLSSSLAAAVCGGSGCNKPTAPSPGILEPTVPTAAQPKLAGVKLWLGAEELNAELARTLLQQQTGMMFRTNLPENAGMLFPLPNAQRAAFWMKNCPLPLSIAYIDQAGVIQEIHDLEPYNTNSVVSVSSDIRFALETPQGWFDRHNIRSGMVVRTERGSLMETCFGK